MAHIPGVAAGAGNGGSQVTACRTPLPALRREGAGAPHRLPRLIHESTLELVLNGQSLCRLVCTPSDLPELAAGHLAARGLLRNRRELRALRIDGGTASVFISSEDDSVTTSLTARWRWEWLLEAAANLGGPLYRDTRSAHSCTLLRDGTTLCCMEDIGRHNALDKAIGWALLRGVPIGRCVVFSSGRLPLDAVEKALRAGITVLASKSLPTAEAAELARRRHLTLLHVSERHGLLQFA